MTGVVQLIVVAVVSYVIGAIPSGLLVGRVFGRDMLNEGSGKLGTANTMNALGVPAAIAVFILDLVKGIVPVLIARAFTWPDTAWLGVAVAVAGVAAILGHNYSLWVRLLAGKWGGGRGIVTALGAMLMLHPLVVLGAAVLGLVAIAATRLMVLGAMAGIVAGIATALLLISLGWLDISLLPAAIAWSLLVLLGFSDSIARLLRGTEPKLGAKV